MRFRYLVLIGLITVFLGSSAYGETFVEWYQRTYKRDTRFGASFEAVRSGQILNPDAGKNLKPIEGLDGKASEGVIRNYRQSFELQGKSPVSPSPIQAFPASIEGESP
jgi:hypothetical protein